MEAIDSWIITRTRTCLYAKPGFLPEDYDMLQRKMDETIPKNGGSYSPESQLQGALILRQLLANAKDAKRTEFYTSLN